MIDVCATAGKTVQGCGLLLIHFCAEIWLVLPILICFIYFYLNMVCFMLLFFLSQKDLLVNWIVQNIHHNYEEL